METEEELRHRYLLTGIASGPATPQQIDALEASLGYKLPVAYRAYLRVCGTHPPKALVGSNCAMGDLLANHEGLAEVIAEDQSQATFPPKFLVFLMHQGYFFNFIPIDGTDDPPVFCYQEGHPPPEKSKDKFSSWVIAIQSVYLSRHPDTRL